jgi:hypothetical protein
LIADAAQGAKRARDGVVDRLSPRARGEDVDALGVGDRHRRDTGDDGT